MIPTLEEVKIQLVLNGFININEWTLTRDKLRLPDQNIAISSVEDTYNKLIGGYYDINKYPVERDGITYRAYENLILAFTDEGVICNSKDQKKKLFIESRLNAPFGFEPTKFSLRKTSLVLDDTSMTLYLNTSKPVFKTARDKQFISWFSWLLSTPYKSLFTKNGYLNSFFNAHIVFRKSRLEGWVNYRTFPVGNNIYDPRLLVGIIAINEYGFLNQNKDRFTIEGFNFI